MKLTTIFLKFQQGISWNAFLHITQKGATTALSFILFKRLIPLDFTCWALINSFIFITLLWFDFGFRKSLPRYCPIFEQWPFLLKKFIRSIFIFQGCVLVVAAFFLYKTLPFILSFFQIKIPSELTYLAIGAFVTESFVILLRLIYHSHFWQKQFNLIYSLGIIGEQLTNIFFVYASTNQNLLFCLFRNKIIANMGIIIITAILLVRSYQKASPATSSHTQPQKKEMRKIIKSFLKHTTIMWMSTMLKSLSERNILIPLFTYCLGPVSANMFKVGNDGAIFFQRSILKTIGTADTSLLTYVEAKQSRISILRFAFQKLIVQIAALAIPLCGIFICIGFHQYWLFQNPLVFKIFIIITISYLIELIFSPYERILEVKFAYQKLLLAYLPYAFMIITLLGFRLITAIGLIPSIIIIHSVRLVSFVCMVFFARRLYQVSFPIKKILHIIGISILILPSLCLLVHLIFYQLFLS